MVGLRHRRRVDAGVGARGRRLLDSHHEPRRLRRRRRRRRPRREGALPRLHRQGAALRRPRMLRARRPHHLRRRRQERLGDNMYGILQEVR